MRNTRGAATPQRGRAGKSVPRATKTVVSPPKRLAAAKAKPAKPPVSVAKLRQAPQQPVARKITSQPVPANASNGTLVPAENRLFEDLYQEFVKLTADRPAQAGGAARRKPRKLIEELKAIFANLREQVASAKSNPPGGSPRSVSDAEGVAGSRDYGSDFGQREPQEQQRQTYDMGV